MKIFYDCPQCEADVPAVDGMALVICPECKAVLRLDEDAEYEGGRWRDLSKLRLATAPDPKESEGDCLHHWITIPGSHRAWRGQEIWKMRCEFCGAVAEGGDV